MTDTSVGPKQFLNAKDVRRKNYHDVDLGDGTWVKAKRLDFQALVFEGLLPMPLLTAVQKMMNAAGDMAGGKDPMAAMEDMGSSSRADVMTLLRRTAVLAVVLPVVVEKDDHNPDHLPVELLNFDQLMAIWTAATTASPLSESEATRFRGTEQHDAAAPVPDGEEVRPAAEHMAAPEVVSL